MAQPQRRNNNLFTDDLPYYACRTLDEQTRFTSKEEIETALWEIAKDNWGGMPANGLDWKVAKKVEKPTGSRQIIRCHYWNHAKCRWCAEVVWSYAAAPAHGYIRIATNEHLNHELTNRRRGPLSQAMAVVSSPSSLQQRPARVVAKMRRAGITMTAQASKAIKRKLGRLKQKMHVAGLENQSTGSTTWGQVRQKIDTFLRQNDIVGFNKNTVYAGNYVTDPDSQLMSTLVSTENLLLNLHRQTTFGSDISLMVDTSYKYMVDKFALMPIKVACMFTQTSHAVGYGIVSHDSELCHDLVFAALKDELERVVNARLDAGHEEC